jgi:hypothetical protein
MVLKGQQGFEERQVASLDPGNMTIRILSTCIEMVYRQHFSIFETMAKAWLFFH